MSTEATIQPQERRLWWPDSHVDEIMPPGRPTPDAWLARLADGAPAVEGDEPDGVAPILLREGQEVMFTWTDHLGVARLTFGDEGETTWSPEPPAACNSLWDGEYEGIVADNPADFIAQYRENGDADPGEWLDVRLSRIPEAAMRLRFTAQDGPPRFVPLDSVPDAPVEAVSPPDDPQGDLLRASTAAEG